MRPWPALIALATAASVSAGSVRSTPWPAAAKRHVPAKPSKGPSHGHGGHGHPHGGHEHPSSNEPLNITIFHVNDIHAHLDEITTSGTDCTAPEKGCYGGYARIKAVVDAGRKEVENSLLLNMGDEFQGTLFFTYYGGEVIADTINQLGFDAMTIGNHEFDRGDAYLGEFLANLTVPIVCANLHSEDPTVNKTLKPYHVFPQYKLAVIAVTTDTIPLITNADESTTVDDPISTIQYWADYVYAHENVERIIVMTHIGYEVDLEMAAQTSGVHLIIGGHSHTLLGNMAGAEGPYPTVVQNLDGDDVYVITDYRYGEYLGYIDVSFDGAGKVAAWSGGPIHLTNTTAQDTALQTQIENWRAPFDAFASEVVGTASVLLNHNCKTAECNFGDLICDVLLDYRKGAGTGAVGCIMNGGGIRVDIPAGGITRGDVLTAFPFGNAVVEVQLTGQQLWDVFSGAVTGTNVNGSPVVSWPQISGFAVTYDGASKTLQSLTVAGEAVDLGATYTVVTCDFVATGGDNIIPAQTMGSTLDTVDEVFTEYIIKTGAVGKAVETRFTVV
ncbi:5'-nucleotidase protein-like protein [Mycena kentingensis (nom. inval.)]|nr:5'-nucleotidase protein-like protein [Mycena kentingensis (nom. inval.)]